jgi:hypothetical protein
MVTEARHEIEHLRKAFQRIRHECKLQIESVKWLIDEVEKRRRTVNADKDLDTLDRLYLREYEGRLAELRWVLKLVDEAEGGQQTLWPD